MICCWSARRWAAVEPHLLGDHLLAGPEPDVTDPAECGDVLVLLADRLSAVFDLDRAGPLRQFLGRHLVPLVREQRVQQADGHRRRRAEPGAARGGDVGQRGDLDAIGDAGHLHGFPHEFVFEVLDAGDDLLLGVVDIDVVVEPLLHDDVDVLVERAVEDPAAVLPVVAGQVGAASQQADSQWCLGDDHRQARVGHSSLAR